MRKITMPEIFKNPRYRGKHVILAAGKVFTAKTGDGADVTPEVAFLPKVRSLTL